MVPCNTSNHKLTRPLIEDGIGCVGSPLCLHHAVIRITIPFHMAESGVAFVVSTIDLHGCIIVQVSHFDKGNNGKISLVPHTLE